MNITTGKGLSTFSFLGALLALAGFSLLLLLVNSSPPDVSAHIGDPFGPASGMVVVDG